MHPRPPVGRQGRPCARRRNIAKIAGMARTDRQITTVWDGRKPWSLTLVIAICDPAGVLSQCERIGGPQVATRAARLSAPSRRRLVAGVALRVGSGWIARRSSRSTVEEFHGNPPAGRSEPDSAAEALMIMTSFEGFIENGRRRPANLASRHLPKTCQKPAKSCPEPARRLPAHLPRTCQDPARRIPKPAKDLPKTCQNLPSDRARILFLGALQCTASTLTPSLKPRAPRSPPRCPWSPAPPRAPRPRP
jgi:hypothetical protein